MRPTTSEIAAADAAISEAFLDELAASGFREQVPALRVLKAAAKRPTSLDRVLCEAVTGVSTTDVEKVTSHFFGKFDGQ